MKKAFLSFFTIVTVTCSLSFTSFADTLNNKSLNNDKVQYNQISSDIKNLDENIRSLNNEINSLNNTITNNKTKVDNIQKNIDTAQVKIQNTKEQLDKQQNILSDRLSAIYKSGTFSPASYLVYILQADGFSQLISRIYDVQRIVSIDDQLINGLKSSQAQVQKEIDGLNKQKNEVLALNAQTQKSLEEVVQKQNKVKAEKENLNTQLQSIASTITANEEQLVSYPIGVINNSNSSISQLKDAVQTLNDLLPQITMQSVINKVNNAISNGKALINQKIAQENAASQSNNSSSNKGNSSSSSSNSSSGNSSNGSSSGQYKKELSMEATAYAGDGITAMGTATVRNPNGISTVAVDPNVIPLGSKLYIPGYGYAIASDTGGAIKGNRIDLFMNSEAECNQFGRRQITVYIVAYPGQW
ncbi:3D domain-containing protein [Clostridium thermobutyricum]|uniref:Cell wall-binding protein YocH n=1 Tax=Clostridium thermobutyricum DSM 4928 TaxID=1121339 RepID=A0A1V4SMZ8_9CLOT|nr:3D domain-containing protein [Clostridium thermobutyricum]OPX45269.1 cell wall-binding protein YocH precursor [Clostridium thermobutyricum DSM 4928]